MNLGVQGSTASGSPGRSSPGPSGPLQFHEFPDRAALRAALRQRRRQLDWRAQQQASDDLQRVLLTKPLICSAQRIAAYIANDGEIDPQPVLAELHNAGAMTLLPVMSRLQPGQLQFSQITEACLMRPNRFGIAEPYPVRPIPPWTLDVVLLPLVGFDRRGGRLGMGGGYYDRSLAGLRHSRMRRPQLIGLAHACQEVDALGMESWDIPLDWIVTPLGWIQATGRDGE